MATHSQACLSCALNIPSSFTPPHLHSCPSFYLGCSSASTLYYQTLAYLSLRLGPSPIFSPKSSLTSLAQMKLPSMSSCKLLFGTFSSAINPVSSAHFDHFHAWHSPLRQILSSRGQSLVSPSSAGSAQSWVRDSTQNH